MGLGLLHHLGGLKIWILRHGIDTQVSGNRIMALVGGGGSSVGVNGHRSIQATGAALIYAIWGSVLSWGFFGGLFWGGSFQRGFHSHSE